MTKKHYIEIAVAVLVLAALITSGRANRTNNNLSSTSQAEVAAFYKDKAIKFIIPYAPGGGYDEYARLLAPFLSKHTGARVDVFNLPGAGGMRGVQELFTSPNNGLIIGMLNGAALATNELVGGLEGTEYKLGEFAYIGRILADTRVFVVANNSGLSSFDQILISQTTLKMGASGLGGSSYVDALINKEALGLNVEIVHGFDSSSVTRQAMLRGDIMGIWGSYGSAEEGGDTGGETIVLQSGTERHSELQEVPTVFEYADKTSDPVRTRAILTAWTALIEVGRSVAAPPGTDPDRLEFLRVAFKNTMYDPEFLDTVKRAGRQLGYRSGEETAKTTIDATTMPPEIKELFVKIIRGEL